MSDDPAASPGNLAVGAVSAGHCLIEGEIGRGGIAGWRARYALTSPQQYGEQQHGQHSMANGRSASRTGSDDTGNRPLKRICGVRTAAFDVGIGVSNRLQRSRHSRRPPAA